MSYCRRSSDDFTSDVYVYEDVYGGWRTHVAGSRYDTTAADMPGPVEYIPGDDESFVRWYRRHMQVAKIIRSCTLNPIGLPYDGQTFTDPTPGECADRLEHLRVVGYRVPDDAIERLRRESEGNPTTQGERS